MRFFLFIQVIMFVVDSTDRDRLAVSKEELEKMLRHDVRSYSTLLDTDCSLSVPCARRFQSLKSTVLLVLANKNDVKGAMTSAEISDFLGLNRIKSHQWHIQSCCALTGEGFVQCHSAHTPSIN